MRLWWIAALAVLWGTSTISVAAAPDELPVKDGDGKTVGLVVQCNTCRSTAESSKKGCYAGAENGWLNGKPCGMCMVKENATTSLKHPYDLHLIGKLVNEAGEPLKDRFVKLFLPNGWTVKTRTSEQGTFRLMLGATQERTSRAAVVTDLGQRIDSRPDGGGHYTLLLLPESYKSCPPTAAETGFESRDGKPH